MYTLNTHTRARARAHFLGELAERTEVWLSNQERGLWSSSDCPPTPSRSDGEEVTTSPIRVSVASFATREE